VVAVRRRRRRNTRPQIPTTATITPTTVPPTCAPVRPSSKLESPLAAGVSGLRVPAPLSKWESVCETPASAAGVGKAPFDGDRRETRGPSEEIGDGEGRCGVGVSERSGGGFSGDRICVCRGFGGDCSGDCERCGDWELPGG
jgi:hypothetical protein